MLFSVSVKLDLSP